MFGEQECGPDVTLALATGCAVQVLSQYTGSKDLKISFETTTVMSPRNQESSKKTWTLYVEDELETVCVLGLAVIGQLNNCLTKCLTTPARYFHILGLRIYSNQHSTI